MAVTLSNFASFRRLLINSTCSRAYLSGFKSNISLDKLYPSSRLDITTIPKPPESKNGKFSGYIPMDKIQVNYVRSSGPGGQNVNCVSTKAEVRFHLASADWIPEPVRIKLAEVVKNQISKEGYFIVKSDRTRSQQLNLADSLEKLRNLIHSVAQSLVVPEVAPETLERQRRLRERAARERLKVKRAHSMTKQGRQAPNLDS
uniref:Large ribosomal subunit protein mL62 n=1 Tax=Simocephalus serrulatus TaxID=117539 RepID=A0A4Y7NMZ9_9CRUS|nr:EOG090X0JCO [Simocephalus serrulatus]SVE94629.1 EOG090X0JCO [Simocephalus serrulatus]